jgi:hypothetical protein
MTAPRKPDGTSRAIRFCGPVRLTQNEIIGNNVRLYGTTEQEFPMKKLIGGLLLVGLASSAQANATPATDTPPAPAEAPPVAQDTVPDSPPSSEQAASDLASATEPTAPTFGEHVPYDALPGDVGSAAESALDTLYSNQLAGQQLARAAAMGKLSGGVITGLGVAAATVVYTAVSNSSDDGSAPGGTTGTR